MIGHITLVERTKLAQIYWWIYVENRRLLDNEVVHLGKISSRLKLLGRVLLNSSTSWQGVSAAPLEPTFLVLGGLGSRLLGQFCDLGCLFAHHLHLLFVCDQYLI